MLCTAAFLIHRDIHWHWKLLEIRRHIKSNMKTASLPQVFNLCLVYGDGHACSSTTQDCHKDGIHAEAYFCLFCAYTFIYVYVHVFVVSMKVFAHVCRSQRIASFLWCSLPWFLIKGLSLAWDSPGRLC